MLKRTCFSVTVLSMLLSSVCMSGCGDDDSNTPGTDGGNQDSGGNQCPNLAGTWTIEEHCGGAAVIGMSVPVTQVGCEFTTGGAFAGFTGNLNADGDFTMTGVANGQTVNCTGTATATRITETCTGDCDVVMIK